MGEQDSVAVGGDGAGQGSSGVVLIVKLDLAIVFDPGGLELLGLLFAWLFGWLVVCLLFWTWSQSIISWRRCGFVLRAGTD